MKLQVKERLKERGLLKANDLQREKDQLRAERLRVSIRCPILHIRL